MPLYRPINFILGLVLFQAIAYDIPELLTAHKKKLLQPADKKTK
jgi:hypothetical protein